jgi:hypothetical protein
MENKKDTAMRGMSHPIMYEAVMTDPVTIVKHEFPDDDTMSKEEIDEIVGEAAAVAAKNEDIEHLRDIIDSNETTDDDEASTEEKVVLTSATEKFEIKEDGNIDFTKPVTESTDEQPSLSDLYELTNEEADNVARILIMYKQNKKLNVYHEMIPSMKARVSKVCLDSGIPLENVNMVARYMMDQFLSTASEDEEFEDIEDAINKAMKIPSMVDMYMEHINDTMDIKLPAMAEGMKEREPEKAESLLKIRDEYNASFLFTRLRHMYDSNTRLRKIVRRDYTDRDVDRMAADVNYINSTTKFKMPDCTLIPNIIRNIVATRGFGDKDPVDMSYLINKFCVLLFGAASYLKLDELNDAAFYYYSIKNISMMAYVGDKLSDFSAELISNMMITMYYIDRKEAEFYDGQNGNQQCKKGKRGHNKRERV